MKERDEWVKIKRTRNWNILNKLVKNRIEDLRYMET